LYKADLASWGITQYWTRPKSPKEKPFVERLIGALQRECLDCYAKGPYPRTRSRGGALGRY
jgi:hypothetical protein